jgi:PAS domain S-box-containing protein
LVKGQSPLRLLIIVALMIVVCEAAVMLIISFLPPFSLYYEALLDSFLLIVLLLPVLYLYLFRPLMVHITEHRRVEEELREHRDRLEELVELRTEKIRKVNETLMLEQAERGRVLKELRVEKDTARKYLDVAGAIMVAIDTSQKITMINKKGCELLGYSEEELLGRDWFEVALPGATREEVRTAFAGIMAGEGEPLEYSENPVRTRSGEERVISWHNSALRDGAGNILGTLCSGEDITERRRLEEQLRHAQKMEAIGRLTGGIAHDFNNILNIIIGHAELLQLKVGEDERLSRDVNDIVTAAERASKLTHSLLSFSRKHLGAMKPLDLNHVVNDMRKMFSVVAGVDIEVDASLAEGPIKVTADHSQIEQVLMNLFTNARDAMPRGGTLRIRTELRELDDEFVKTHGFGTPGPYASITVTDTGIGIDDKTRASIFEPFFTTKGVGRGTGLGLAVAYGIIQQHNGHIDVRSSPGEGTTFTIYLPVTAPDAVEAEAPAMDPPSRGSETILVAEDDKGMRELAVEILTNFGYKVVEAGDGEEAVRKYRRNKKKVKLLLLDVMMPGKNGREVYEEIRKVDPSIKVLFLSGYPSDVMGKEGGLEKGFDVMLKPVSMNDLLVKVRNTLDAREPIDPQ